LLNFTTTPPLSLYIHVPWCVRKCPYCDFNSHEVREGIPEAAYIDALIADLEQELPDIWGRPVSSVFIGGGTPSLLSPEALDRLLSQLRALVALGPETEITLEANPGTVDQSRFAEFRRAGINRLSIGIQSFDDALLERIGRIHSGAEALAAAEAAIGAGFDNLNLDLMFGLPGQSVAAALSDLERAIAIGPAHISYYQLTIEPNTAFGHRPPVLPDDDLRWAMFSRGQERLAAAGFGQYEVSAYARPGRRCRHNLNYWEFGDYLGIGAGAHQKLTHPSRGSIVRRAKQRHPKRYLETAGGPDRIASERSLSRTELPLEFMMNALRLNDGFPCALFAERTGLPISTLAQQLRQAEQEGLILWDISTIRPTEKGRLYLDTLLERFIPEE
jgi:putative oxygen-independent coproporphyrinogen III oxidase